MTSCQAYTIIHTHYSLVVMTVVHGYYVNDVTVQSYHFLDIKKQ